MTRRNITAKGEERKEAVFKFILEYKKKYDGNSPTFREIVNNTDLTSVSMTTFYLKQLEEDGLILIRHNRNRSIIVVDGKWISPRDCKICGKEHSELSFCQRLDFINTEA